MKNKSLIVFLLVSVGQLVAIAFEIRELQWICKPLIMLTLGYYYYSVTQGEGSGPSRPVLGAILFSLAGDVFLMFQTESKIYFMLGLVSFLIAHLFYILSYSHHKKEMEGGGLHGIQKFRFALPVVLAGTGLITILYSHLGPLRIPVTVYSIVLIVMVLKAMFRWGYTYQGSFWFVFLGALLFMVSDSLIAINKFLHPFGYASMAIIMTYILAQFLIISGLAQHGRK